jgi:hypothetical protein
MEWLWDGQKNNTDEPPSAASFIYAVLTYWSKGKVRFRKSIETVAPKSKD